MLDFREEIEWSNLSYSIFINGIFGNWQKSIGFSMNLENLLKMKRFFLKNSKNRFQNSETRFQNAKTHFQNVKTPLSRIFFAKTWKDSAFYGMIR